MSTKNTLEFFPKALRSFDLYPKVAEMLDYIMENCSNDFNDIETKYRNPSAITEDIFSQVMIEYGFKYINDIVLTLKDVDRSILFHFIGLLHFYKGTRQGLELILDVLGMSAEITEWWERPEGEMEPFTFDMLVYMDLSNVKGDLFTTLEIIKKFTKHYVFPVFKTANVSFIFEFAQVKVISAGFSSFTTANTLIEATI